MARVVIDRFTSALGDEEMRDKYANKELAMHLSRGVCENSVYNMRIGNDGYGSYFYERVIPVITSCPIYTEYPYDPRNEVNGGDADD